MRTMRWMPSWTSRTMGTMRWMPSWTLRTMRCRTPRQRRGLLTHQDVDRSDSEGGPEAEPAGTGYCIAGPPHPLPPGQIGTRVLSIQFFGGIQRNRSMTIVSIDRKLPTVSRSILLWCFCNVVCQPVWQSPNCTRATKTFPGCSCMLESPIS
ncbi:hypothetical protein BU23DRAFT_41774 [Bimuria novae-zelandiae CBS 107.79]|uniref:Uncharacterized protein n=1 Tax=Bimuria novae-zelandiae CBS 107.79 TaxID=1447943 RepID=A0A6A5VHI4_9PLEO|nr:hypothetical protein BU23DRAFT_41774 [Bimuria novae-zelandiae CBS 107.79]